MTADVLCLNPADDDATASGSSSPQATDNVTALQDEDEADKMIGDYTQTYLLQKAKQNVTSRTKGWEIFDQAAEDRIPKFDRNEITTGSMLGKGGFFVVNEITEIILRRKRVDSLDDDSDDDHEPEDLDRPILGGKHKHSDEDRFQSLVQNRNFMSSHCIRDGTDCRYAFKIMQDGCKEDANTFVNTVTDLVLEARFLSVVRHPNIIKMRGVASCDPYSPDFFIILDRLYDTLKGRTKQWHKRNAKGWFLDFGHKRQHRFLAERLTIAYDIASALEYLHDLNIIYRDLKPTNVGFDVRDDVKLYDFGLAVEHDEEKAKRGAGFRLTGDTGTMRYMAPEGTCRRARRHTGIVRTFQFTCQWLAHHNGMISLTHSLTTFHVLISLYIPSCFLCHCSRQEPILHRHCRCLQLRYPSVGDLPDGASVQGHD